MRDRRMMLLAVLTAQDQEALLEVQAQRDPLQRGTHR